MLVLVPVVVLLRVLLTVLVPGKGRGRGGVCIGGAEEEGGGIEVEELGGGCT